jgi:hypothetical protein
MHLTIIILLIMTTLRSNKIIKKIRVKNIMFFYMWIVKKIVEKGPNMQLHSNYDYIIKIKFRVKK